MQDAIRVFAGQCTVTHQADETTEQEGEVVVLVKPDNTVLVHDASGYRPAGWLTRADSVRLSRQEDSVDLRASKDGEHLRVLGETSSFAEFPVTAAGPPVGTCPTCDGTMVRAGGDVSCLDCGDSYRLPRDADVTENTCDTCGLPTISVTRGATFEVCLDRECESIDEAVTDRFDDEWDCPTCGTPLSIERERTLLATCPTCDDRYSIPSGEIAGTCECGLPWFETERGGRCLDPDCTASTRTGSLASPQSPGKP
jgi:DNA topoisomerase-1